LVLSDSAQALKYLKSSIAECVDHNDPEQSQEVCFDVGMSLDRYWYWNESMGMGMSPWVWEWVHGYGNESMGIGMSPWVWE
jgi:hypothetical protein